MSAETIVQRPVQDTVTQNPVAQNPVQHVHFVDGEAGVSTTARTQTQPMVVPATHTPVMPDPNTSTIPTKAPPSYSMPDPSAVLRNAALHSYKEISYDQVFQVEGSGKPKFHDVWATVLFVLVVAKFIAVTVIVRGDIFMLKHERLWLPLTLVFLVPFCLSQAYLLIIHYYPTGVIYMTGVSHIILCLALGITCFTVFGANANSGIDPFAIALGCVFLVSALVSAACLCSWKSRIPYSAIMLQTTTSISRNYGHMFLTAFLGGLLTAVVTMWYFLTLLGLKSMFNYSAATIVLGLFVSFAFFWITEVIKNVIHVTVSGVYGSYYFCSGKPCGFPLRATRSAFGRATTYSFGSISLGSLLVTIVRFLEQLAQSAAQSGQQDACQMMMVCFARLLLLFLRGLMEMVNVYAFSFIALFGTSYVSAAKSTWRLMKDRGITLLVNECLIDPVLSMGAFFIGAVCLAISVAITAIPKFGGIDPLRSFLIGIWAFFIAAQMATVFLAPIKSGVTTLFVAMAFDPEVLINDHPELYRSIVQVYPQVAISIRA